MDCCSCRITFKISGQRGMDGNFPPIVCLSLQDPKFGIEFTQEVKIDAQSVKSTVISKSILATKFEDVIFVVLPTIKYW